MLGSVFDPYIDSTGCLPEAWRRGGPIRPLGNFVPQGTQETQPACGLRAHPLSLPWPRQQLDSIPWTCRYKGAKGTAIICESHNSASACEKRRWISEATNGVPGGYHLDVFLAFGPQIVKFHCRSLRSY